MKSPLGLRKTGRTQVLHIQRIFWEGGGRQDVLSVLEFWFPASGRESLREPPAPFKLEPEALAGIASETLGTRNMLNKDGVSPPPPTKMRKS
ncbi:MAG: hypothetical protein VKL39_01985 [Leptolyngbyaceae bacterium]|nr:hypothetical protein [Leptolyngbyaceae bacterium]